MLKYIIPLLLIVASCSVAQGNPIMESYPRQCQADGQTFTEQIECVNFCGNHKCDDQPCTSISCPCVETQESCPEDCNANPNYNYKSTDPVECTLMIFECSKGEEMFLDNTGCGCRVVVD